MEGQYAREVIQPIGVYAATVFMNALMPAILHGQKSWVEINAQSISNMPSSDLIIRLDLKLFQQPSLHIDFKSDTMLMLTDGKYIPTERHFSL